jgi:hypothetical protein
VIRSSFRSFRRIVFGLPVLSLFAALLGLALTGSASVRAQDLEPQITSEIACRQDSQCPSHGGLCFWNGLPGCGCNEGAGHCDANPKECDFNDECFGREICSTEGRCVEPGPREGAGCNFDGGCAPWMSCIEGRCSRGECLDDGDCNGRRCEGNRCVACTADAGCAGGQVCREGACVELRCIADEECGPRSICTEGRCVEVDCKSSDQCRGCSICEVGHQCTSLCREGERCLSFPSAQPPFFLVQTCANADSIRCASRSQCPLGFHCLGGRCFNFDDLFSRVRGGLPGLRPKPEKP